MAHLLVDQLRFARSEFVRCLEGVSAADAQRRLEPMNCISWIIGHMANQENWYWVKWAQKRQLAPALDQWVGYGQPASTPPLEEMWATWRTVTEAADKFLDTLTADMLQTHLEREGNSDPENIGTRLLRNIYHYWYHTGEAHAIRQQLGHQNLPDFVGDITLAAYRLEK